MITSIGRFAAKSSMISVALAMTTGAVHAQSAPAKPAANQSDAEATKEIVVTGSSIKGVAPVGSNLTTVGRAQLDALGVQTVQQILKTVPAVVGINSPGQGGFGSFDGSGTNAPTIHSLGASASNSTLILINGHRLPTTGVNHVLADPNIVPTNMLERVEVLADGASSVYGSDAVAGVVNFITRRNVKGIEASVQKGFGKQYGTFSADVLFGTKWDTGSVTAAYTYSTRDSLNAGDRAFTTPNHIAQGGTNQQGLNTCSPAVITTGGNAYFSPYTAAGFSTSVRTGAGAFDPFLANAQASTLSSCDIRSTWDLIPSEKRHNAMVSIRQEVGDKLTLTADFIYAKRVDRQNISRGQISGGTIFGPAATAAVLNGSSINPFFVLPTGVAATTASETINFDADSLLGPGAHIDGKAETLYGRFDAVYKIAAHWNANVGLMVGTDTSRLDTIGQLCGSCANLALNGKTSAPINGVNTTANLVLTTANALDPFGNSTSAATKAFLTDSYQFTNTKQNITDIYAKIDGDLFQLPAGSVKIAVGGEYLKYTISQDKVFPTNLGPSSTNSGLIHLDYNRDVKSAYAELFLPLVGPEQNIPGVRKFDVNVSGRYDKYSDFGDTSNPKVAANWEVVKGFKFRGNWGKSFVAPALTSRGANAAGQTAESSFGNASPGLGSFSVPYASFPTAATVPGCPAAPATSCTFNAAGGIAGLAIAGGNANLKPQKGTAWSIGADFTPDFAPGLRISATYWSNKLTGGITAPAPSLAINAADLSSLLQIYPAGATAAQIAAAGAGLPAGTANPTTPVYFIYNFTQNNVVNLDVAGIDFDASYRLNTSNAGKFTFGVGFTRKTKFNASNGAQGAVFDALGTAGVFTTFQAIKLEGRANVGWDYKGFDANVYVNYTGDYINRGIGVLQNAVVRSAAGVAISGGDPVNSFTTVDLNVSYKLQDIGFLKSAQLFADVTNLFDKAPPFVNVYGINGGSGYDGLNGNPIGRVITIGLRTKF
jgi:iron complex outermembrane receptor protein